VARLVPMEGVPSSRTLGLYQGRIHMPDDFDATLPAEMLEEFEGGLPPESGAGDPPGSRGDVLKEFERGDPPAIADERLPGLECEDPLRIPE